MKFIFSNIKNILLLFFVLVCLFNVIKCIEKYSNVKDALKNYPQQDRKNGAQPKFVYFKMNKSKSKELDYFSKVLYRFMQTMGVRPYFVNLNDSELLGIVPKEADINIEAILDTFKGIVDAVEIKDTMQ